MKRSESQHLYYGQAGIRSASPQPTTKTLSMHIEIVGEIQTAETFARGSRIRELPRLRKTYGAGNWRKRKGVAKVRFPNGLVLLAEIHWYEATGIGKREFKIKRYLE